MTDQTIRSVSASFSDFNSTVVVDGNDIVKYKGGRLFTIVSSGVDVVLPFDLVTTASIPGDIICYMNHFL